MKKLIFLAVGVCILLLAGVTALAAAPQAEIGWENPPKSISEQYLDLSGEWHFKVYRKYNKMYQYFYYGGVDVTWENLDDAAVPNAEKFNTWETLEGPSKDYSTSGLLQLGRGMNPDFKDDRTVLLDDDLFPKWSEAWFVKEITIPSGFLEEETVTLLLSTIDDVDVVYINGTPVAASGFITVDKVKADPTSVPATGGFIDDGAFKFETSYWEVPREYVVDASLLHEGTNEIAVRLYNNNSMGGFYQQTMALSATKVATRWLKGLPTDVLEDSAAYAALVNQQTAAIMNKDIVAYAATLAEDYNENELDKAEQISVMESFFQTYKSIEVIDKDAGFYIKDGEPCYSGHRMMVGTMDGEEGEVQVTLIDDEKYIKYLSSETMKEVGNWSSIYTVTYTSKLEQMNGRNLDYSIYLPPSYYEDSNKNYPIVYLLHGMNSTGRSFVDVNKIDVLMDDWISSEQIEEMIVVMPNSGKTAGYRDSEGEPNDSQGPWGSHISIDIRNEIEANYRTINDSKFRALTGISMGGGGVFSVGMANTDLYSSISSIMGAVGGAVEKIEAVSDEVLAGMTFYLDCGIQDRMVNPQSTQDTGEYLESRNANVEWELRDGGHNSGFISDGLVNAMRIHSKHFVKNGL